MPTGSRTTPKARTVFSKDFCGCLMVVYSIGGQRRVALAACQCGSNDGLQAGFPGHHPAQGAVLGGWFKPFIDIRDGAHKFTTFAAISK